MNGSNKSEGYGSKNNKCTGDAHKEIKMESVEEANTKLFTFFKYIGIFLVHFEKNNGDNGTPKYKLYRLRYVLYYIFWFLWPFIGFASSLLIFYLVFEVNPDDVTPTSVRIATLVFVFGVLPAFQTYVIKRINEYVPTVLMKIRGLKQLHNKRYDNDDIKWKHFFSMTHQTSNIKKLQYPFDNGNKVLQRIPIVFFVFTLLSFIAAGIYAYYDLILWKNFETEFPYFTAQFFILTLPCLTTWFCISFIIWNKQKYRQIDKYVENVILKKYARNQIDDLGEYVDQLQDIFNLLSKKILKYTFGINFLVFTLSSLYCTYHFITDVHKIYYTIPLIVSIVHMFLSCEQGHTLINQYETTVNSVDHVLSDLRRLTENEEIGRKQSMEENCNEEMKKIKPKSKEDYENVERLLENLRTAKPQAEFFGSFNININTFVTIIGFIISYSVLVMDLNYTFVTDNTTTTVETLTTSVISSTL